MRQRVLHIICQFPCVNTVTQRNDASNQGRSNHNRGPCFV
ncbi:unnamed protein product [Ectocarpus sp. CCAP 1310/34]|nr:unnamed protein product [Ectocarpus sp. CCAP 1310/34]